MNKWVGMGRLTKDPDFRTTGNGTSVCMFTVAIDRRFKDANGERQADFIPCVAWRQSAELIQKHFKKGNKIGLVGSIQTRSRDDTEGKKHYATEAVIDEVYFVESKTFTADAPAPVQALDVVGDNTALPFDV